MERSIAAERIGILLDRAVKVWSENRELAKRYVALARRIGMRTGVRIPSTKKRFLCKRCGSPLIPGRNCRVRLRTKGWPILIVTCLSCGALKRFPASEAGRRARKLDEGL